MGGTVTNLAAVKHGLATYDADVVRGTVLDRAEIDRQIELYRTRDTDARRAIVGLQPKRADVILAGACIVRTVMEKLGGVADGERPGPPPRAARRAVRRLTARAVGGTEAVPRRTEDGEGIPWPRRSAGVPHLSDADLAQLMALIKGADSVELKATIPASAHRTTVDGLPLDPVEAQPRQVFFFDTPDLALNQAGVVVRARRIQGGRGDTVVKLRPVVPADLPPELRRSPGFNVEVDVLPGGFVCSASFKGRSSGQEVHDAVTGVVPLRAMFSKEQRAFYTAHAPGHRAGHASSPWVRRSCSRTRFQAGMGFQAPPADRLMVAELWLLPGRVAHPASSRRGAARRRRSRSRQRPGPTSSAGGP